jgi:hypothetical protein
MTNKPLHQTQSDVTKWKSTFILFGIIHLKWGI